MTTRLALLAAAAAAAMGAVPAHAQADQSVQEFRRQIDALRQQVEALQRRVAAASAPASGPSTSDRLDQVELKQQDAVTAGDTAGSFRLPGSDTSIHLYGYAETHALRDFQSWGAPDNFSNLPGQSLPGDGSGAQLKGRTKFTAETSRFGIDTSTPTSHGPFNTKIEADFYAYGPDSRNRLRLRHAYGEYAGWLVGQTWGTFMDLDDTTETVDFNAQIGVPFTRRAMIRYTWGDAKAGDKFTFAAEDPQDQYNLGVDPSVATSSVNERMPNLVARYDQAFDWGGVNVRALTHEKRSPLGNSRRGYGLGVGGNYKLTENDLVMFTVARVDGDFDNMIGSNGYWIDGSQIMFDRNVGFALGWNRNFGDSLRANVSYEENRAHLDGAMKAALGGSANHRLQQVHAGAIYTLMKNVELGAEYLWGRRETYGDGVGRLSRLDLMGRYSF